MPLKGIVPIRVSSSYESEAWGKTDQANFLNAVVEVGFQADPISLLDKLLEIERDMGRIRREKWGPRIIDLDIIEYNGLSIRSDRLSLPHPYYLYRGFVLYPLQELEKAWIPTGEQLPISHFIQQLSDSPPVRRNFLKAD